MLDSTKTRRQNDPRLNPKKLAEYISSLYEQDYIEFKTKTTFSPSSLGWQGSCPRYWSYAFNGADFHFVNTASSMENMERGTDEHNALQKMLEEEENTLDIEKEVTFDDPPIRGFVDIILDWEGLTLPGEFKTAKEQAFIKLQATNKPYDSHILQIMVYMHILEVEHGVIVYKNKNDGNILVIPVYYNEHKEMLDHALDWMRRVYIMWQEDQHPKRPFRSNSRICKGCPVRDTCFNDPRSDLEFEPLKL